MLLQSCHDTWGDFVQSTPVKVGLARDVDKGFLEHVQVELHTLLRAVNRLDEIILPRGLHSAPTAPSNS